LVQPPLAVLAHSISARFGIYVGMIRVCTHGVDPPKTCRQVALKHTIDLIVLNYCI
jgi:hypothetical protein